MLKILYYFIECKNKSVFQKQLHNLQQQKHMQEPALLPTPPLPAPINSNIDCNYNTNQQQCAPNTFHQFNLNTHQHPYTINQNNGLNYKNNQECFVENFQQNQNLMQANRIMDADNSNINMYNTNNTISKNEVFCSNLQTIQLPVKPQMTMQNPQSIYSQYNQQQQNILFNNNSNTDQYPSLQYTQQQSIYPHHLVENNNNQTFIPLQLESHTRMFIQKN